MAARTAAALATAARGSTSLPSRPSARPSRVFLPSRQNRAFLRQSASASGLENIPGFGSGLNAGIKIGKGSKFIKPEDVVIESEVLPQPLQSPVRAYNAYLIRSVACVLFRPESLMVPRPG